MPTQIHDLFATADLLPDILFRIEGCTALIHVGHLHGFTNFDRALIRFFLPGDQPQQGGLPGSVGANYANDAAGWDANDPDSRSAGDRRRLWSHP